MIKDKFLILPYFDGMRKHIMLNEILEKGKATGNRIILTNKTPEDFYMNKNIGSSYFEDEYGLISKDSAIYGLPGNKTYNLVLKDKVEKFNPKFELVKRKGLKMIIGENIEIKFLLFKKKELLYLDINHMCDTHIAINCYNDKSTILKELKEKFKDNKLGEFLTTNTPKIDTLKFYLDMLFKYDLFKSSDLQTNHGFHLDNDWLVENQENSKDFICFNYGENDCKILPIMKSEELLLKDNYKYLCKINFEFRDAFIRQMKKKENVDLKFMIVNESNYLIFKNIILDRIIDLNKKNLNKFVFLIDSGFLIERDLEDTIDKMYLEINVSKFKIVK